MTQGSYPPPASGPQSDPGLFEALFAFSFTRLVTPPIVEIAYVLVTILIALLDLSMIIAGFANSMGAGFAAVIIGAVLAFVCLILARITLELYRSVVTMSMDIREMKNRGQHLG